MWQRTTKEGNFVAIQLEIKVCKVKQQCIMIMTHLFPFPVLSWITSPLLSGAVSIGIFYICKRFILEKVGPTKNDASIHL